MLCSSSRCLHIWYDYDLRTLDSFFLVKERQNIRTPSSEQFFFSLASTGHRESSLRAPQARVPRWTRDVRPSSRRLGDPGHITHDCHSARSVSRETPRSSPHLAETGSYGSQNRRPGERSPWRDAAGFESARRPEKPNHGRAHRLGALPAPDKSRPRHMLQLHIPTPPFQTGQTQRLGYRAAVLSEH